MEKELDLTLRLGLPNPTFKTHLSLNTLTIDQGINFNGDNTKDGGEIFSLRHLFSDGDEDEGGRNNVNIRVYNHIFQYFAGVGETLNFAPYPMPPPPSPSPDPSTPAVRDYVLIDANANAKRRRGCNGCCGGNATKKCTNCNAVNTPMWRRGPLGPKSLCNACGIKFRKEEKRRSKTN
ncbi:unnamed protein product [Cochlearia groenlandica]